MALTLKSIFAWCIVSTLLTVSVSALQCYNCGQYNDGVGSITPCINDTHMKLINCPAREINYCIKYTSEGTLVRDCVGKCTEKDNWDWSSRTFCCQEDGCNAANYLFQTPGIILIITLCLSFLLQHLTANRLH